MTPRQRFFDCLQRSPPALFEAALWMAVEHDSRLNPEAVLADFSGGKENYRLSNNKFQPDYSAPELLILTADGKLIVRSTRADSDPDTAEYKVRQQRVKEWKTKTAPYRPAFDPANMPPANVPNNPFLQPRKGGGG